ncbi:MULTISPECIES: acyl-CoA reductase [Gammaproteobacteria]|uniref:acyl-CoA reductase n=1 Tax=Gammaproteobacteria TaxID=1236 RepID=UPI000DCFCA60|nr:MULTISPECIES: acyl-CoA reductase [Gammaproteobacteria]RTE86823.1 acyl-CoA reductase [Aliidiomarina sp. B3213]TCZ93388.1 acyl-CoA reductase [Lysobacter sp. N42]
MKQQASSWQTINEVGMKPKLTRFADHSFFAFTSQLSNRLIRDAQARDFPDLVALGYWLRNANMQKIAEQYESQLIRPLGHVFHAAPGNVDSLFVYSGILSLLCGNVNTIRLSSKVGGSADVLCDILAELAPEHPEVSARFQLIRCERDDPKLKALQANVDARVLWGSNEGIKALKSVETPAHCRDIVFAHKISFSVLGIDALLRVDKPTLQQLVEDFARDNLTFSQQACSSAKWVIWQGNEEHLAEAQNIFWTALLAYLSSEKGRSKYKLTESERYQALNNAQDMAMAGVVSGQMHAEQVVRVWAKQLREDFSEIHRGAGLFVESHVQQLQELNRYMTPAHQTMTYWGVEDVHEWLKDCLVGVDRVVPVGQALNFDVVWDGVDLVTALGRVNSQ